MITYIYVEGTEHLFVNNEYVYSTNNVLEQIIDEINEDIALGLGKYNG